MKKKLLFLLFAPLTLFAQDFWTECQPFPDAIYHVSDIAIVDQSLVWVIGSNYEDTGNWSVWRWGRSTDGGLTWTNGFLPDDVAFPHNSNYFATNIAPISGQVAFVGMSKRFTNSENKLLLTQDAGATWTQIHPELYTDPDAFVCGIHFFDATHGVIFGDEADGYFEIHTTNDAGITWTRTPSANIPALLPDEYTMANHFDTNNGTIWFMTNKKRMFRSLDQGLSWTVSQTPSNAIFDDNYGGAYYSHRTFSFKNQNEGLLVTTADGLYQTTDGGLTWNPMVTAGLLSNRSVVYVPQTFGTYYNTGRLNTDLEPWHSGYSTDNGNSWTTVTDNPEFIPILTEFLSPTVGYASGYHTANPSLHGFFRLSDPLLRLLKNDSFMAEKAFTAAPNPTSDIVKLAGRNISSVAVFDLAGKMIFSSGFQNTDIVSLDISAFDDGVYLAKVTTGDGATASVKVVKK